MSIKSRMSMRSKSPLRRTEIIDDSETECLFADAMADVKRLEARKTAPRVNGPRRSKDASAKGSDDEELLKEFLRGETDFDWSFHPGYHEGGPERGNRKLIRKLRRGGFAVQAKLDLHGSSQKEAESELDVFLAECISRNLRCVRIIHGKGNNSRDHDGVLRKSVPRWLSTERRARLIIAYTTAPPQDGGIGATYVLLRKRPLPRNRRMRNAKG